MTPPFKILSMAIFFAASGCASVPNGPSVMVMPASGATFEQFRNDDTTCQQYALSQVGGTTANQAGMTNGVTTAVVGTAVGSAAGAAFGGGEGAAIGAGSGLLVGSLIGANTGSSAIYDNQQRYDNGYIQCMYAKGHQVPVSGQFPSNMSQQSSPPTSYIPPPPPVLPPPPR